ncbi:hypothetical protein GOZ83_16940 [Agrobacterium vitis]|uniref:hypothetical protein n=1 Tax=Rhizobium/Agrobacterium group TaxID=227290 RepID=UPI0012E740A9|nr:MULTISPECIES: hypothetical protein [Rhizobium/Agrobacterium group]MCF1494090.1 hypothetical protein [Allorhizobium ampelinum]MVA46750.1 hypothetical protein [Agrobacterium vitis]
MSETLTFHFEGALADSHRMNFYESARFQYAAARLIVKLAQFRQRGKFVKNITNKSNFSIKLKSQSDGSFNINIEDPGQTQDENPFINISLADLVAYVSERVIEKIDEPTLATSISTIGSVQSASSSLSGDKSVLSDLVKDVMTGEVIIDNLAEPTQELVKRRIAESHREKRLTENEVAISLITSSQSQKLIAMSAPLIGEMATAFRTSADTLEVRSSAHEDARPVLFLNRKMAAEIETAIVDKTPTLILGDIVQFNKDNGWGKIRIENGTKTLSFSIPYDILPIVKKTLIDNMNRDQVYVQVYFVRDKAGDIGRMIVVGISETPTS